VTRGQLPQRAGSLGLNDGGTAAAVPPPDYIDGLSLTITKDYLPTATIALNFGYKSSIVA